MIKISYVMIIIVLCFGCARHLRIYSKGCNIPAMWLDHNEGESDFKFEYKVYGNTFGFDATRVNIVEMLKKNKLVCEEINSISIESKQNIIDIITGVIPFLSRTTLNVEGTFRRTEKEALDIDVYGKQREEFDSDYKRLQQKLND